MTTSLLILQIPLVTQRAVFFYSTKVVTIFFTLIVLFCEWNEDEQYRDEVFIMISPP